jgi:hypothetical protein
MLPSCLSPLPARLQGIHGSGSPEETNCNPGYPLMGLCSPSENAQTLSGRRIPCRGKRQPRHPPMRLWPLQRIPAQSSGIECPGLPHLNANASRFSQPLDALIRPVPAGRISDQIRSWGFPLQSFAPPAQPYAVPDAIALLTLDSPVRLSPPATISPWHRNTSTKRQPEQHESVRSDLASRALLRTRVRHPHRWVGPKRARSSLGVQPLQGVLPRWNGPAFTTPPLMRLPLRRKRLRNSPLGYSFQTR